MDGVWSVFTLPHCWRLDSDTGATYDLAGKITLGPTVASRITLLEQVLSWRRSMTDSCQHGTLGGICVSRQMGCAELHCHVEKPSG